MMRVGVGSWAVIAGGARGWWQVVVLGGEKGVVGLKMMMIRGLRLKMMMIWGFLYFGAFY
ncbi:hypothetical protein HanIR_Chr05g0222611 [Helianthus annuus]|nr:hypothetical protein HanIR_Chr05g0222611 [Helianthus annuus]